MSQHFYFDIWPANDYVGAALGELSEATDRKVRIADQSIGSGEFTINRHSAQAAWCVQRALVRVRLATGGPFAYDDPRYVAAFFIETSDDVALSPDEEGGEDLNRGGPAVESILKRAINYPNANIPGHASYWTSAKITGDIIIKNKTVGEAFRILILNAMDRVGNLPGVTIDFTINDDSAGTPWPDTDTDWRFPVGMTILEALSKLVSSKSYYRMTPGLLLSVYEDHPGVDRSGSITFAKGVSLTEAANKTIDASNFMSRALVRGQKSANQLTYLQVFDTSVEAETGRVEGYVEFQTTPTTARLQRAGQQAIDKSKLQQDGPVTSGVYDVHIPFVDYQPGDLVTVDIPDVYDSEVVRIAAITLTETEGGEYDVIHEYQAVPFDPASGPDNFATATGGPGGTANCGDCPETPPFVPDVSGSAPVYAVLYGPNNRPDRAFYPYVGWYGDGDAPPTGYASAPKSGPVDYVDRTVNGLTQRWALRATADMTVDIHAVATMAEVFRPGSWSSTFRLLVNNAVIHGQTTPESCPDLCYFADSYDHTETGVELHAGDVVSLQAFWSYGGVPVLVPAGTDGGMLEIDGTAGAVVSANEPLQGQWVGEEVIVAAGDTTYATNYAYAENSLHVYAEGVHIVVDQTDPETGAFALASELPAGTHLFLWYQATTGDYLGTGNPPAPGPRNGIIPYPLLGDLGDGTGTHVLHDDGTWRDECCSGDDTTDDPIDRNTLNTEVVIATVGSPDEVNFASGTDSDGGGDRTWTNPTNANDEPVDTVGPTYATLGSFAAGAGTYNGYLKVDLGADHEVYDLTAWGDWECSSDPTVGTLGGFAIEYSLDGSTGWTQPAYTMTWPVGTAGNSTERTHFALTSPIVARYWRLRYYRIVPSGFAFMCGSNIHSLEINGAPFSGTDWAAGPEASDGDDTTYEQVDQRIDSAFVRSRLSSSMRIGSSRLLVGFATSGTKTLTLYGANEDDYSDEVLLATEVVTATGSYTGDEVVTLLPDPDAYQFYRWKDSADHDRRVYTWELYDPTTSTDHVHTLDSLSDVDTAGAVDGDVLTFDDADDTWKPVAPTGGSSVPDGTDPGDILVWDGDSWEVLPVGTDGQIIYADSGETLGLLWDDAPTGGGGGGSLAHAYAGYNTIGGSSEAIVSRRQYMKKVTFTEDTLITSIGAYIKQATANEIIGMSVGVLRDNAGSPDLVLASAFADSSSSSGFFATNTGSAGAARWVHVPIGFWVAAGDYWLAVEFEATSSSHNIYYDGSGSDRYFTNNALRITDSGWTSVTTSSNKYSIRADTFVTGAPATIDDPIAEVFGTPDTTFEFNTSSTTGLTAYSPTPDVMDINTTVPGHLYIKDNASGVARCGYYASAPSAPFTAICKISDGNVRLDYHQIGLAIGVATPGTMNSIQWSTAARKVETEVQTPTGFTSALANALSDIQTPLYLAILVNSSSDVDFLYSYGGRIWAYLTEARDPGITIASIGVWFAANNSNGGAAAFDFLRIWNSAKSFPGVY